MATHAIITIDYIVIQNFDYYKTTILTYVITINKSKRGPAHEHYIRLSYCLYWN